MYAEFNEFNQSSSRLVDQEMSNNNTSDCYSWDRNQRIKNCKCQIKAKARKVLYIY